MKASSKVVKAPVAIAAAALVCIGLADCAAVAPAPGTPLEGTYWQLASLQGQPVAASADARAASMLLLQQIARATGFAGCNRFTTSYERNGNSIHFKPGAMTRMACMQGMDREQAYMKALESVASWRVDGDRLQLLDGGNAVVAEFKSASQRYACDDGQVLMAYYDNTNPQRAEAIVTYRSATFEMRSAPTGSGARYVAEQGRKPDMSLEWRTKGDEGTLMEAPLDDSRKPDDLSTVTRCTRK